MTAGLELTGAAVTVDGATLLRDVDLHVPAESMTVVVGPSGAGKTTLLRAVAGLVPLAAGRITLAGRDLAGVPPHRRRVAVVFQQPRLFPALDVADNVAFALRVAGVGRAERRRRAGALLEEVGLPGIAGRGVGDLSGGEQQRVALARSLAADPDLLALDEPLAAVDPARREELRRLIARVRRDRGLTALHVTHDRVEAAELADRLALLVEGRIIEQAPPRELFERPRTAVAARFMGSTNLVTGPVRDGVLTTPAGTVPVDGPNGDATVTIRPERIVLGRGPLRLTVLETTYQGGHVRAVLAHGRLRLEAHVAPDLAPAAGAEVEVDLPRDHLWRLRGDEPSSDDADPRRLGAP
jgi:ABC-type Fe3+/spermidine/putrescine transport system ATPase subunit